MENIKISIDEIYSNLLLTAISRRFDFYKLVKDTEEEIVSHITKKRQEKPYIPEGFEGLLFVEIVARKMGSSLGEVYNLSSSRKEELLHNLIDKFDSREDATFEGYCFEDDGTVEFKWSVRILDAFAEKTIKDFITQKICGGYLDCFSYYLLTFRKELMNAEKGIYYYSIFLSPEDSISEKYMANDQRVWSGSNGSFADYIDTNVERFIEEEKAERAEDIDDCEENDSEDEHTETIYKIKNVSITEYPSKQISDKEESEKNVVVVNELVASVANDTRTIDLLDTFEGYGVLNQTRYRRIVIKNLKYAFPRHNMRVGFHLVIERGTGHDYVGNITFTEFKKGEDYKLREFVLSEIDDETISQYVDKDQFYRFSKPFLLRAQNSSNRTGYGWEWDWSGGYGDYTEGTFYGETTNYFFVGAYVSSFENCHYNPDKREHLFKEDESAH